VPRADPCHPRQRNCDRLLRWGEKVLPAWQRPPAPPASPSGAAAAAGTLAVVFATRSPQSTPPCQVHRPTLAV
jgi:hypothetical protein